MRADEWVNEPDAFFPFLPDGEGRPVILWRSAGDNDGHAYSAGLSLVGPAGTPPGAELTCIDCHSAHGGDPRGMITEQMRGSAACAKCHESIVGDAAAVARRDFLHGAVEVAGA